MFSLEVYTVLAQAAAVQKRLVEVSLCTSPPLAFLVLGGVPGLFRADPYHTPGTHSQLQEGDTGLLLLIQLVSLRVDQLVDTLDENQFVLGELHSTMPRRLLVRVKL